MVLNLFLMVVLGTLEGIGILLLIPLLHFAGIGEMSQTTLGISFSFGGFSKSISPELSLPVVLIIYMGLIVMQSGLQRYQSNLSVRIQQSLHSHLSIRIFQGLAYAKWPFLAAKKKSDLTTIFASELARVSGGTHFFFRLTATAILAVIQVLIAFLLSPLLTLLVIGGGLVFYVLTRNQVRQVKEMGVALSRNNRDLFFAISEHLNGIKEVKSCGLEELHITKFRELREAIANNFVCFNQLQSRTQMLYKVGAAAFISIFFYSMVSFFHTQAQEILIIIVIFARLWPKFASFQGGLQQVTMMLPAFLDVMDFERQCQKEKEIYLENPPPSPQGFQDRIEFKNVYYSYYPEQSIYAVKNLSFTILAGSTAALVGASGSGKSTVADLLTGMLIPQKGQVLIDGFPLNSINVHLWRRSIGYVPQDAFLFNASIRDNMLWAYPEAKTEDIWKALHLAAVGDLWPSCPKAWIQ